MLLNIIRRSFQNQKKSMLLMAASVSVGTAMVTALLALSFDISGKMARELRTFGANLTVEPKIEGLADIAGQKRYLRQEDIVKTKTIFWRHNIIGVAPFLEADAEVVFRDGPAKTALVGTWYAKELPLPGEAKTFIAGIKEVYSWWELHGRWDSAGDSVVVGDLLAERHGIRTGDSITIGGRPFMVNGTLETGGKEDEKIFMDLEKLQALKGLEGKLSRVSVSALTTPMDDFAYKDTATMTRLEYEKWYCTGYVTSIAKQLEEVFSGSKAKPIWNVAETEGRVLNRLKILIYLLCAAAFGASAAGVSTTMVMSLMRRMHEIALMKALGAGRWKVLTVFLSESFVIAAAGGVAGYLLSIAVTHYIGESVFSVAIEQRSLLPVLAFVNAALISFAGTILPMRKVLAVKPAVVLKGAE